MDKYEYQVCTDQIKALVEEKKFAEAMDIADTIDWRKSRSVTMLCMVSDIYKINRRYEESRDILLLAYERFPTGRTIVYALCELAIKMKEIVQAVEYYKEYVQIAPQDTGKYVLLYKIYEAQEVPLEERIDVLEELKRKDYQKKWAYELAYLYHLTGQEKKCVKECDELILWFGEGKYVKKAMELKMQHTKLSEDQKRKYEDKVNLQMNQTAPLQNDTAVSDENPYQVQEAQYQQQGMAQNMPNYGAGYTGGYVEGYAQPQGYQDPYQYQNPYQNQNPYENPGIQIQPVNFNVGKDSTLDLQKELARNMQELRSREQENIVAPYYGQTSQLYESVQNPEAYGQYYPQQMIGQDAAEMPQQMYQSDITEMPQQPVYQDTMQGMAQDAYAQNQQMNVSEPVQSVQQYQVPEQPVDNGVSVSAIVKSTDRVYDSEADSLMVEKQITGQMSFDDLMKGWEEKKKEETQKHLEEIHQKVQDQTEDIMSQLEGVIPQTKAHEAEEEPAEEKRASNGSVIKNPITKSEVTSAIPSALPGSLPSGRLLTLEEEYGGDLPNIRKKDEELVINRMTGELPKEEGLSDISAKEVIPEEEITPIEETTPIEEAHTEEVYEEADSDQTELDFNEITYEDASYDEKSAEVSYEEKNFEEFVPEDTLAEEEAVTIPEEVSYDEEYAEDDGTDYIEEEYLEPVEEYIEQTEDDGVTEASDGSTFTDAEEYGEVEELEEIDVPDDLDDMLKTRELPLEEIQRMNYEAGIEPEMFLEDVPEIMDEEEDEVKKNSNRPSYMVLEESVKSRREFDEDEKRIFARYEGIESVKAQIVDVMDDISMDSNRGNVIVMGSEISGRKGLAIDIVKAIQAIDSNFSGKVAKISGEALNKKDIGLTIKKLINGALIVENAGGLTKESMVILANALNDENDSVLVVLEDSKEAIEPLLGATPMMRSVFDARISIHDYTDDDLVAYGKGYAKELEYSIDEVGVLALHERIAAMQTLEHKVSIDEVKEIIDAAIKHVDKKNISHFMDVLLGKRYDNEDCIVLREKDFIMK